MEGYAETPTQSQVIAAPTNRRMRSETAPTTEELPLHRFKADFFGTLEQPNVSQHLARLREKNILVARKQGIGVFYSVRDPKLFQVLGLLREYFYEHLSEIQGMMRQLREPRVHISPMPHRCFLLRQRLKSADKQHLV